jgi:hypothetical protein
MKIYFTATTSEITEEMRERYQLVIDTLKKLGHRVIVEHMMGNPSKIHEIEKSKDKEEIIAYHRKLITWKHQADIMVVEASKQSFRVGQEISYALSQNKPVIVLFEQAQNPLILRGIGDEYLHLVEYTPETLKKNLEDYIEYAKDTADTRFNFFVSSDIDAFLNFISREKKTPRAVFLRQLIEQDMKKNKVFQKQIGVDEKK